MTTPPKNFLFVHGLSVRSGTNFIARVFSKYENVEVIPRGETTREFPLLKTSDHFKFAFESFAKRHNRNMGKKTDYEWSRFKPFLGNAFIEYISENLISNKNASLYVIKEPGVKNLNEFFDYFGNSRLIILVRDGRDMVESMQKAYLLKHRNQSILNRAKRNVSHIIGREYRANVRMWANNARTILNFLKSADHDGKVMLVKYEDLVSENVEVLRSMFEFCGQTFDQDALKKVEIMASSFSDQLTGTDNKATWKPLERTDNFNPIGRWKNWKKWKIRYFENTAGAEMTELGYDMNDD